MDVLIAVCIGIALFAVAIAFAFWLNDFSRNLKYINMEIGRSDGREREHWEKEKRKFILSKFFFFYKP